MFYDNYNGFLHYIGFAIIFYVVSIGKTQNFKIGLLFAIILILLGGFFIEKGRNGSLVTDITGRLVFSVGFTLFTIGLINSI
jgi:hypothetical protein